MRPPGIALGPIPGISGSRSDFVPPQGLLGNEEASSRSSQSGKINAGLRLISRYFGLTWRRGANGLVGVPRGDWKESDLRKGTNSLKQNN